MRNIINIVNFIRGVEPRMPIDLVEPVARQIELMKEHKLPGTFLFQYDALIRPDMTGLFDGIDRDQFEIGVWLEMNRPMVEAAGLPWRGRPGWDWDSTANVGFSVGYAPDEREKLVDVLFEKFREQFGEYPRSVGSWMIDAHSLEYMQQKYGLDAPDEREKLVDVLFEKFREQFGEYPRSVGSWMIDAHSLEYMQQKYGLDAACICKDQWGTDGYTIWGGYWNQGYYPSRYNVLCPAQTQPAQISVPMFRMLGSDPVTQYDLGLDVGSRASECQAVATLEPVYPLGGGSEAWIDWFLRQNFSGGSLAFAGLDVGSRASECQAVATLEPVYPLGGGSEAWIDWFLRQNFSGGSLAFAYAQAGQENSFGWADMAFGLKAQFSRFEALRDQGKLVVERMGDTGRWFKRSFDRTPATSVAALEPMRYNPEVDTAPNAAALEHDDQSVWYDCKNYRVNWLWRKGVLRLRDFYLFDEAYPERYLNSVCETSYLVYDNLPIMDGNRMSGDGVLAGGYLVCLRDGQWANAQCSRLRVSETERGLRLDFEAEGRAASIELTEQGVRLEGGLGLRFDWCPARALACQGVQDGRLRYRHNGADYALSAAKGRIEAREGAYWILPEADGMELSAARA